MWLDAFAESAAAHQKTSLALSISINSVPLTQMLTCWRNHMTTLWTTRFLISTSTVGFVESRAAPSRYNHFCSCSSHHVWLPLQLCLRTFLPSLQNTGPEFVFLCTINLFCTCLRMLKTEIATHVLLLPPEAMQFHTNCFTLWPQQFSVTFCVTLTFHLASSPLRLKLQDLNARNGVQEVNLPSPNCLFHCVHPH